MSKANKDPEEIVEDEVEEEEEEEDDISDEDLGEFEEDGEYVTTEALLTSTLMTEDGDTVCSALVNIGRQMEIQNKILVKLISTIQNKK